MSNYYDYLIVGAGITGLTLAQSLSKKNYAVLLIEKDNKIGGNCYDCYDEHGVLVHPYGPHIFHTNYSHVQEYVSQFTAWIPYEHKVRGFVQNLIIPIPFNFNSLRLCFSAAEAEKLSSLLLNTYYQKAEIPILDLMRSQNPELASLGEFIYSHVFEGYTMKQWGLLPHEIDPAVTARVPVRLNYDDRYFTDSFQAMPEAGYSVLFQNMLNSFLENKNSAVMMNMSYKNLPKEIQYDNCLYTGTIDEFYEYKFDELPYRSVRFDWKNIKSHNILPTGVLNYPDINIPWTRIIEYTQLTQQSIDSTTISIEFSEQYEKNKNISAYPVITNDSSETYQKYVNYAREHNNNFAFLGRLGSYKYYNMDLAIYKALEFVESL